MCLYHHCKICSELSTDLENSLACLFHVRKVQKVLPSLDAFNSVYYILLVMHYEKKIDLPQGQCFQLWLHAVGNFNGRILIF